MGRGQSQKKDGTNGLTETEGGQDKSGGSVVPSPCKSKTSSREAPVKQEPCSPRSEKKKRDMKVETLSKTKRAKLEIEEAVAEPNRVHAILQSCGIAFCGDLTVEQISLSPALIPTVRAALDAVQLADLGVQEVTEADPHYVNMHKNPRFSLTIHILPANHSMPFLCHDGLISFHRVMAGDVEASEYIKEVVLSLQAASPAVVVQVLASPRSLHLSGSHFVLNHARKTGDGYDHEDEGMEKARGNEGGGAKSSEREGEAGKDRAAEQAEEENHATNDDVEGEVRLLAVEGHGNCGKLCEYVGRAWGPVAMGTRMADSARK